MEQSSASGAADWTLCVGVKWERWRRNEEYGQMNTQGKNRWTIWKLSWENLLLNISIMFMENFFSAVKNISLGKYKHDYWRLNVMFQEGMETV